MDFALRTYTADPRSVAARRRRRVVAIGLVLFCLVYGLLFAFFAPYLMVAFAVPPAVMAMFVVWALPEARNPPTRSLEFLLFALLVSIPVWPSYLSIALPGLPWITVIRLSAFPMALILLICLSTSHTFQAELGRLLSSSRWISTLVYLFAGMEFLSIVLSAQKFRSLNEFIVHLALWPSVFTVSVYVFNKPGRAARFAWVMWAATVLICLIGLFEGKTGHTPWANHIPKFLKIEDPLVEAAINGSARAGVGIHRVQATFNNPATLSEYLALIVPFVFDFAVQRNKVLVRIAAAGTVVLMAFVVFLSGSRSGSIGFLVAFLAYGFFWSWEQRRTSKSGLFGSAVFFGYPIAAFLGVVASLAIGRIRNKIWGGGETQASNLGRITQWHIGIPLIEKNPIGHGVGQSGEALQYRAPSGILTVDSFYLTLLLEVGVVGFLIFYATWAIGIATGARTVMKYGRIDKELSLLIPVICTLLNFLIIKSVFSQEDNHPLAYAVLGMGVALMYRIHVATRSGGLPGSEQAALAAA